MEIDLSDIVLTAIEKKGKYETIAFTEHDKDLICEAKRLFGKKQAHEIMRRSIRAGITKALDKFGDQESA